MKPNSEPKYQINETVEVCTWTRKSIAPIIGIAPVYHIRMNEWTWGYKFETNPGLTYEFIPEGYLRKYLKAKDE